MPKCTAPLPDWELVLSAAARPQRIFPEAVLVGGTASATHAKHRFSRDADHVLTDLRNRFDCVLKELESVAGWKTVKAACSHLATVIFDKICELKSNNTTDRRE